MSAEIQIFTTEHPNWRAYVQHLERVKMAQHGLDNGQPSADGVYLGALLGDAVVGHITLKVQPLVVPATEWSQNQETVLQDASGSPLRETYVQTFAVEDRYRRQRIGLALQEAALAQTKMHGCYQMRSWSSADKPANYALKLAMGFAAHPATYALPDGRLISGVYFVMTV